jgi:hypothetical protein
MKTIQLFVVLIVISVAKTSLGSSIFDNTIHIYKYGPATFSVGEIDVDSDAMRLATKQWPKGRPNPVSNSLYILLDESAHQAIEKYMAARAQVQNPFSDSAPQQFKKIADDIGLEAILITNFNRIIQGPCIYDKNFRGINGEDLSPSTEKLLKQKPQGENLIRLNWLLLQDAWFADSRASIQADGDLTGVFKKKEHISRIEIFVQKLSKSELQDIWICFSQTNKISLADITEDKIKPYADNQHSFQFDNGKLIKFSVYSDFEKRNIVALGSTKNNSSLTLPCSAGDFEKVFGKADEIDRMTMW